jgi:hypothetical protein
MWPAVRRVGLVLGAPLVSAAVRIHDDLSKQGAAAEADGAAPAEPPSATPEAV